jgi:Cu/Ag efflux protein CusF
MTAARIGAQEAGPSPGILTQTFEGEVRSIDPFSSSITVRDKEGGEATFDVPAEARIFKDDEKADLSAVREGDQVVVRYMVDGYGVKATLSLYAES